MTPPGGYYQYPYYQPYGWGGGYGGWSPGPYGFNPWGPPGFALPPKEQQIEFLRQQAQFLEQQLNFIKQQIEALEKS